jgi:ABC-type multidrug transport system fused ATPase/permease subunit
MSDIIDTENEKNDIQHINLDNIILESINEYKIPMIGSVIMFIIGLILAHIVFPNSFSALIGNITDMKSSSFGYKDIFFALIPYIASEVLIYFADMLDTYYVPKIEFLAIQKISNQVLESVKINKTKVNTTELILNLKKIFDLKSIYHLTLVYIMPMLLLSITLAVYFWYSNKRLGLLSTIILIITFVSLVHLSVDCTQKSIQSEQKVTAYCDDVNDIFLNIDNVISAGAHKSEVDRIILNGNNLHDEFVKRESCNSNLKFTAAMMYFGVMIGLNGMSVKLFYENAFDKTTLMTIFLMVLNLVQHCDSMIYEMHNITQSVGNYKEIKSYFEKFKLINPNKSEQLENKKINFGNIEFSNVTVYNGNRLILNKINCTINNSEKTALIGNIGTGKTTLIKALLGLLKYEGVIKIDNINVNDLGNEFISKNIAYIPQNPRLFNRTIFENLTYGTQYTKQEIIALLKQFNMYEFFMQFENGLDSNVGSNGDKLSGGQRQLVFILRSIIQNKKIFVLDEPTSSLDENHKNMLFQLLDTQKNKTIIVITHDKEILHFFDTILLLEHNKIKQII